MKITYLEGDATRPDTPGNKFIVHICNDIGMWGSGFVMAISRRWSKPKTHYQHHQDKKLGTIDLVQVEPDIWVVNMIAQKHIRTRNGVPPIRYGKLAKCLMQVAEEAKRLKASIHMPKIGCGLAGGSWNQIEPIIQSTLPEAAVFVYYLKK